MVVSADFETWKAALLEELEAESNAVAKGDRFVQRILRYWRQLSEDDAINATEAAGGGDHGIDGLMIDPADEDDPAPHAWVMQGKYGAAGLQASPLAEFHKFANGLASARGNHPPTPALEQCAAVLAAEGTVQYVIATIDPLSGAQLAEIESARAIANQNFGPQVMVESISLADVFQEIVGQRAPGGTVSLACHGVNPRPEVYIGAASLVDAYMMLREYAVRHGGVLDGIYDRNVRKWLGERINSVNGGINTTLRDQPDRFVAYNNGITIVCRGFQTSGTGLQIDTPQIVNGCQTTRTLYNFMENHFAGQQARLNAIADAEPYRTALLPFKLIAVVDLDAPFVQDITRYSNKQNAVRGRDFLTLESDFHRLKSELAARGYFLEVQTGEYNVLPKSEKEKYPRERLINAFDALRFYGAAVLRRPHTAFGRSGEFTPGGREFETVTNDLGERDLLVPWLMAGHAVERGYSVGGKWGADEDDYRNQTRYFYLYMFFRVASQVLHGTPQIDFATRAEFYAQLTALRDDYLPAKSETSAFHALLDTADRVLAVYMALARKNIWFFDRNAFLKSQEPLLNEEHILLASGELEVKLPELRQKSQAVLKAKGL